MISIRESIFESNSSSCHSLTITKCPVQKIVDFNNGSRAYVCIQDRDDFYTLEETAEKLIQDIQIVDDWRSDDYYLFGGDELSNIWTGSDSDIEDFKNAINWLKQNLTVEMFCWAFDENHDSESTPFISRKILQVLLRMVIEKVWSSPLLLRKDMPWGLGRVTSIRDTDNSDVTVNLETGELCVYDEDKSEVRVELNFRD